MTLMEESLKILQNQYTNTLENYANADELWIGKQFGNIKLVYNNDGDVVGRLEFRVVDTNVVFFDLIAVYPEFRNMGYFRQILNIACRSADSLNLELQLIPLPTESSHIASSTMMLNKLKSIYKSFDFLPYIEDVEICQYFRKPNKNKEIVNDYIKECALQEMSLSLCY